MIKLKFPHKNLLPALTLLAVLLVCLALAAWYGIKHSAPKSSSKTLVTTDTCAPQPLADKLECYTGYFNKITQTNGATASLTRLEQLYRSDPYVRSQCHPLAHNIGHFALKFYGSVAKAAAFGKEICWSGYYHGIMESYMEKYDDTKLLAMMPQICPVAPGTSPYSFDHYNCVHGLGHGVTIRFNNDIFKALPYCDALNGSWEQGSCYGGVFMQNIVVDGSEHTSKDLRADDPVYPCDAVAQRQKQACYLMVTSNILKTTSYDYAKAFAVCDHVEAAFISTCYQSMGRDISGNFILDPVPIIARCNQGNAAYRNSCYIGASKNAVFDQRNTSKATELCSKAPAAYQTVCRQARDEAAATL